ncbi:glycosyltransferase [Plectonema radiosum NIES-515]|uniref:Glycosyltransferase n=1 Tax=Plectonema radiosum NIES-515 TaxID=2986073 RepID=A0ABT3B5W6_9CYAN|nr:glycosyltransferase [Plectonema radiosum]MCV3216724.1 glycosyltransferase [Plectonema radiosum NIES-515]
MLKVHVLFEHSANMHPHGSSHIRLLLPLTHQSNAEAFILSHSTIYSSADVVIVERMWKPNVSLKLAEDLVEQVRKDKACLIYTIDDNLLDLKPEEPNRYQFTTEQLMAVRYFAREADGIIVSTDCLKDRLNRFNNNIIVVPNALDERLLEDRLEPPKSGTANKPKVIGYMGTYTHDADLMMILQALRQTLGKHLDTVELQLIGGIGDPTIIEAFNGLPIKVLNIDKNGEYPDFMRWMAQSVQWDLAIAPLEDNIFTRCKSDIKFLDYSILGIPGIYSKVTPYEKTVRHLETGYLASNNPQAWEEAFETLLVDDDTLRQKLATQAEEYVLSSRTLKHCAQNWRDAILSIMN